MREIFVETIGRLNIPGKPRLLVHGGAWDIPDEACEAHRVGIRKALETGQKMLLKGESAVSVVAAVVAKMESDGAFDAGSGAVLNKEGFVELDAGIMDGSAHHFGAVAGIKNFTHPVEIAKAVLEKGARQFCFLSGEGAENFALSMGFNPVDPVSLICPREQQRFKEIQSSTAYHTSHPFLPGKDAHPRGTVGCVALDQAGNLAAATSTGGTPFRIAGRIGDSPLPGCGYFADETGAASATGWGEAIASVMLCYEAVRKMEALGAVNGAGKVIAMLQAKIINGDGDGATGGVILLSADGTGAFAFSTPRMARGAWGGEELWVEV